MAKHKKIQLSIPAPCSENWDNMTPDEKGKFCAHCQKPVIDFTNYTNKELIEFFSKVKESVCGKINNIQLNTALTSSHYSDTPLFKRLLLGGAFAAGAISTVSGQSNTHNQALHLEPIKTPDIAPLDGNPHGDSIHTISGLIINSETMEPISFAEISMTVEGDSTLQKNTLSYAEGHFTIAIDNSFIGKTIRLSINMDGYVIDTRDIYIDKLPVKNIEIAMQKISELPSCSVGGIMAETVIADPYQGNFQTKMELENSITNTPGVHVNGNGSVFPSVGQMSHK